MLEKRSLLLLFLLSFYYYNKEGVAACRYA